MIVSAEYLRTVIDYEPDTGIFRWAVDRNSSTKKGMMAGSIDKDGYVRISIEGKIYRAGRLAYCWMTGSWPSSEIDHKNLVKDDDRWINLRVATRSQNQANRRGWGRFLKGVSFDPRRNKYVAAIKFAGRCKTIGRFNSEVEAHAAYVGAAKKVHSEFARAN